MNFHPAPTEWGEGSIPGCIEVQSHGLCPIPSTKPSNMVPSRCGVDHLSAVGRMGWRVNKTHVPPFFPRLPFILPFHRCSNSSNSLAGERCIRLQGQYVYPVNFQTLPVVRLTNLKGEVRNAIAGEASSMVKKTGKKLGKEEVATTFFHGASIKENRGLMTPANGTQTILMKRRR